VKIITEELKIKMKNRILSAIAMLFCITAVSFGADKKLDGAPYVDSKTIKERFSEITEKDMDMLRTKKILFASRSFGLNMYKGLSALAKKDKKYEFLSSYKRYDVFKAGGDLSIIPADAFKETNFVHFMATYYPHTKRVEEMDTLLRKAPHKFGDKVDAVIIFYHTATTDAFKTYSENMDAWRKDFPKAHFIYVTAGFMGPKYAKDNEKAHAFSEMVRARYKGKAPLYDMAAILSDDFRAGHFYCPEYSNDPADVHPNLEAGETMLAKGFLLVLRDAFLQKTPDAVNGKAAVKTEEAKTPKTVTETLAPDNPDYKAVRKILDANQLTKKKVENVAVVSNGRITELFLQEGGISELPDAIGTLTALKKLHLYGDRTLKYPLLKKISPSIGKCTELEELLLNQNDLSGLPEEIVSLKKIKNLSLGDNRLKGLSPAVLEWVKRYDPKGVEDQKGD